MHVRTSMYKYIYIYICVCVCLFICIYIYIYTHTRGKYGIVPYLNKLPEIATDYQRAKLENWLPSWSSGLAH